MRIDFSISQDHIDRGKPFCPESCAIVLALNDACPGARAIISWGRAYLVLDGKPVAIPLTARLKKWMHNFDFRTGKAQPIRARLTGGTP